MWFNFYLIERQLLSQGKLFILVVFKLSLLEILQRRGQELDETFLITESGDLSFRDLSQQSDKHLDKINQGDVVALIGDFDKKSIADLFTLLERKAVIVPLTSLTKRDHEYFFDIAQVEWVVEQGVVNRRYNNQNHPLIEEIKFHFFPSLSLNILNHQ